MSKGKKTPRDDIRREYDFSSMAGGVRGKYTARLRKGTNLVLLEPEIAEAFPSEAAVNEALRGVLGTKGTGRRKGRPLTKPTGQTTRSQRTRKKAVKKSRAARG